MTHKLYYNLYMCGRFSIAATPQELSERYGILIPPDEEPVAEGSPKGYKPRYNAAPSQALPVIVDQDGWKFRLYRWGLIPHWSKDMSIGYKMINARAETLEEKPSYRRSLQQKRCLVPADGFYEWLKEGTKKFPQRFTLESGKIFSMAGLWDTWESSEGLYVNSFTIITTVANRLIEPIHDRMPVIFNHEAEQIWMNPTAQIEDLMPLLRPYPATLMKYYPVSPRLNTPMVDNPTLIEPVA